MTDIFSKIAAIRKENKLAALCIVTHTEGSTPRKAGSKMIVYENREITGSVGGGKFELQVIEEALTAIRKNAVKKRTYDLGIDSDSECGGVVEVYIEPIASEYKLIIFGYGHVGRAVAKVARNFGFRITVVDIRERKGIEEKEDEFDIIRKDYAEVMKELPFDQHTFIIVATSEHAFDEEVTAMCAKKPHAYLGMIGSVKKVDKARRYFLANNLSEAEINSIDMPIGIKFNAQTPDEIAISIIAKLIDVKNSFKNQ